MSDNYKFESGGPAHKLAMEILPWDTGYSEHVCELAARIEGVSRARGLEEEAAGMAAEIADDLFTNGFGDEADRLVLTSAEGRDLGGWCRGAVRDRIAAKLRARAEAVRRGEG